MYNFRLLIFLSLISFSFTVMSCEKENEGNSYSFDSCSEIPSCWENEYNESCYKLDFLGKKECVFVGFITDLHYSSIGSGYNENLLRKGIYEASCVLNSLSKKYQFSQIVFGGDYIQLSIDEYKGQTQEQGISCVKDALSLSMWMNAPTFLLRGNHEYNYSGTGNGFGMTSAQYYAFVTSHLSKDYVIDTPNNWAYYDDQQSKIRYVFLDVIDSKKNESQYTWLKSKALATIPSDFSVMFFSHFPLVKYSSNGDCNTYYSDLILKCKQKGVDVIACVAGHLHADKHLMENGILHMTTLQAGFWTSCRSEDGQVYVHQENTSNQSAFDVLAIDKKNRKIYIVRLGLGNDRVFEY